MVSIGFFIRDRIADHLDGYRNYHITLKYMYRLTKKMGINLFVIGPDSFRENKLWGNQFKAGKWRQTEFDYPQIVYTRVPFTDEFIEFQKKIEKKSKIINELKLKLFLRDKYQSSKFLSRLGYTQPSVLHYQPKHLIKFLKIHQSAYLKPFSGSWGTRQIKVSLEKNSYLAQFSPTNRKLHFESEEKFINRIEKFMKKRKKPYLIQEEIQIAPYENRAFDIRVLIQKNGRNIWKITGMGARVSKRGCVTSNINSGGSFVRATKILRDIFGKSKKKEIIKEVKTICKDIAKKLDRRIGRCGELGFDILVDKTGKPWILEINSQPGYIIFNRMGINPKKSQRFTQILCQRVLEYGKYLASVKKK